LPRNIYYWPKSRVELHAAGITQRALQAMQAVNITWTSTSRSPIFWHGYFILTRCPGPLQTQHCRTDATRCDQVDANRCSAPHRTCMQLRRVSRSQLADLVFSSHHLPDKYICKGQSTTDCEPFSRKEISTCDFYGPSSRGAARRFSRTDIVQCLLHRGLGFPVPKPVSSPSP
jgi:hypothetical protein